MTRASYHIIRSTRSYPALLIGGLIACLELVALGQPASGSQKVERPTTATAQPRIVPPASSASGNSHLSSQPQTTPQAPVLDGGTHAPKTDLGIPPAPDLTKVDSESGSGFSFSAIFNFIVKLIAADDKTVSIIKTLILAILGIALGWAGNRITEIKKRLGETKKRLDEFRFGPRMLSSDQRKNTVLLVGQGRVGKTLLREKLLAKYTNTQTKLTQSFDVLSTTFKHDDGRSTTLTMCDYRGQSFLQLIRSFIKAQYEPEKGMQFGDIESLILVVDLFPFHGIYKFSGDKWAEIQEKYPIDHAILDKLKKEMDGEYWIDAEAFPIKEIDVKLSASLQDIVKPSKVKEQQLDDPDYEHLKKQVSLWNEAALDAVFALIPAPPLKFVCLFVNKLDRWKNGTIDGEFEKKVKNRVLKPLVDDLTARCKNHGGHHIEFRVIPGSAMDENLNGLNSLLVKYARSAEDKNDSA